MFSLYLFSELFLFMQVFLLESYKSFLLIKFIQVFNMSTDEKCKVLRWYTWIWQIHDGACGKMKLENTQLVPATFFPKTG